MLEGLKTATHLLAEVHEARTLQEQLSRYDLSAAMV